MTQAVRNQLRDALNAALSLGGSALSGLIREGAGYAADVAAGDDYLVTATPPGGTGGFVVGIAEAFETY